MADNEIRLVSKIVREKDIKPAIERGVQASWFVNPQARQMWEMILEHWQLYGITPTVPTMKDQLPGCTLLNVEESYDYLLNAFIEWRMRGLTVEMMQAASSAVAAEDFTQARIILAGALASIEDQAMSSRVSDIDLRATANDRAETYLGLRQQPAGLLGLPTGFPTIDRATLGLQRQQLVTIVAVPKVGKSTLSEAMSEKIFGIGKVPLLVSFEMSNEQQARRIDSMYTGVSLNKLMSGNLDEADENKLRARLQRMSEADNAFHLIADPSSTSTVSGIAAKIEQYNPDVVLIDGVYMMLDERTGEHNTPIALTNITRALKRLAQKRNVPIVIATQALTWKVGTKGHLSGDSIGYSSSFFQDSDVILGLEYADLGDGSDPADNKTERMLRIIASRDCGRQETMLIWDWEEGKFEEYAEQEYAERIESFAQAPKRSSKKAALS